MAPFEQVCDLDFVHAFEGDGVDLDLQSCCLCGIDSGDHFVQIAPARNGAKLFCIKGIERDIDAIDATRLELGSIGLQLRPVGG